jgi:hypothetical protein
MGNWPYCTQVLERAVLDAVCSFASQCTSDKEILIYNKKTCAKPGCCSLPSIKSMIRSRSASSGSAIIST